MQSDLDNRCGVRGLASVQQVADLATNPAQQRALLQKDVQDTRSTTHCKTTSNSISEPKSRAPRPCPSLQRRMHVPIQKQI